MDYCVLDPNTNVCIDKTVLNDVSDFSVYQSIHPGRILAPDQTGEIGWTWTGSGWQEPEIEVTEEQLWEGIRRMRKGYLTKYIDKINAVRWNTFTDSQRAEITEFRQALLDVTNQAGAPTNVTWPTVPDFLRK